MLREWSQRSCGEASEEPVVDLADSAVHRQMAVLVGARSKARSPDHRRDARADGRRAPFTMGSARTLASNRHRRFAEDDYADASPLYRRVALALSESDATLRAIEAAKARKRNPSVILAALHYLAFVGRAPACSLPWMLQANADAYDAAAAPPLVPRSTCCCERPTRSLTSASHRTVRLLDETGRHAVLYPAIAEAVRAGWRKGRRLDRRRPFGPG